MKTSLFLISSLLAGIAPAQTDKTDPGLYPANTTIRGYAKRDRVMIGGLEYFSPTQLHENEALRGRLEAEMQNSNLSERNVKSNLNTPSFTLGLTQGWQQLTIGLQASYLSAVNDGSGDFSGKEDFRAQKIIPEAAYTFGKNFTLGGGVELTQLKVTEKYTNENEFSYAYPRGVVGAAFHTPRFEVGIVYTGEVQQTETVVENSYRTGTLSLAAPTNFYERSIYLPAMTALYARGNLSDHFGLSSVVAMSRYDANVDGAIKLFDKYRNEDRLTAKILGTYWTTADSRISLAGEYKGAATTAIGSEEAGLGYRLANLYGATMEGVLALDFKTYIGANASYLRGERDELENATNVRYSAREETSKIAGFVMVKF